MSAAEDAIDSGDIDGAGYMTEERRMIQEVARELTQGSSRIQVQAKLKRSPDSPSGFSWTSGEGPPDLISAGTTAAVRAIVEYRRPITFVIPILRKWSGIG